MNTDVLSSTFSFDNVLRPTEHATIMCNSSTAREGMNQHRQASNSFQWRQKIQHRAISACLRSVGVVRSGSYLVNSSEMGVQRARMQAGNAGNIWCIA